MFLLNTGAAAAVAVQLTEKDVTWLVDFPVDPSMVSPSMEVDEFCIRCCV